MRGFFLISFGLLMLSGCSDSDAEKVRRVGDKTLDRVTQLSQQVYEELGQTLLEQKAQNLAASPSLAERVTQRLRWDRDLAALEIGVNQREEIIVLSGKVKTESQRKSAQELAERTLGVQKVQNDLMIEETPAEPGLSKSSLPGGAN